MKGLLAKRNDLKLIITSATIDTQTFSKAFNDAPIIEVSGRLYPVEVIYAPFDADDEERGDIPSCGCGGAGGGDGVMRAGQWRRHEIAAHCDQHQLGGDVVVFGDQKPGLNRNDDFFDSMGRNVVRCFLAHVLYSRCSAQAENPAVGGQAISMPTEQICAVLRSMYETSPSPYARQLAGPLCGLVDETFSGVVGSAAELTTWLGNDAYATLYPATGSARPSCCRGK